MKKVILRSDALPPHLQTELATMQRALDVRYGVASHAVGAMMTNLIQLVAMIGANDLTDEQRATAVERAKDVCGEVISVMGQALGADRASTLAVVQAYTDMTRHFEEELVGPEVLAGAQDETAAILAKAARH